MCCNSQTNQNAISCHCSCRMGTEGTFLSRKKRIELLKAELKSTEEKAEDLREFIKELQGE